MLNITKETYENNGKEIITDKLGELRLNERHVQQQLGHKNLQTVTNKYVKEYKKSISELNESKINHVEDLFISISIKNNNGLQSRWIMQSQKKSRLYTE